MKKPKSAVYRYGVRVDALATPRQLAILAATCATFLGCVLDGNMIAAVFVIPTAFQLVRWCREKQRAAEMIARRQKLQAAARAWLAYEAGAAALYRLSCGLQRPLRVHP